MAVTMMCHYDGDEGWKQTHMYVSPQTVTLLIFADRIPHCFYYLMQWKFLKKAVNVCFCWQF